MTEFECQVHGIRPAGGYDERHHCTQCGQSLRAVSGNRISDLERENIKLSGENVDLQKTVAGLLRQLEDVL